MLSSLIKDNLNNNFIEYKTVAVLLDNSGSMESMGAMCYDVK